MKKCTKCGVVKTLDCFYGNSKGGLLPRCKTCHLIQCAESRRKNPDYIRRWKEKNPDAWSNWYKAHAQERRDKFKAYREINKESVAKRLAEWTKKNSDRVNARVAARQIQKHRAIPKWANRCYMADMYTIAKLVTEFTGIRHEVDHIVPLKGAIVSGLHWEGNLQVLPKVQNISKLNRYWPDMPC